MRDLDPAGTLQESSIYLPKPPTPTASPPTHRKRSASSSSTELVRRSFDMDQEITMAILGEIDTEITLAVDNQISDNVPAPKSSQLPSRQSHVAPLVSDNRRNTERDITTSDQSIRDSETSGTTSDQRNRYRCKPVSRTQSLRETLVQKFGTSFSYLTQVSDKLKLSKQVPNNASDSPEHTPQSSSKPIIIKSSTNHSSTVHSNASPPTFPINSSPSTKPSLLPPPFDYNPFAPSNSTERIMDFEPSDSMWDSQATEETGSSPLGGSGSRIGYLFPGFQGSVSEPKMCKDAPEHASNQSSTRHHPVNRSGVLVPDAIFTPSCFTKKLSRNPSSSDLDGESGTIESQPSLKQGIDFETASGVSSPLEGRRLSSCTRNSNSPSAPFSQQGDRKLARSRPGSLRRSVHQVLPDKNLLKEKASSSECLVMPMDQGAYLFKKPIQIRNDSQENLQTDINHVFTPRPPLSKKPIVPSTDSDDNSDTDCTSVTNGTSSTSSAVNLKHQRHNLSTGSGVSSNYLPPRYRSAAAIMKKVKPVSSKPESAPKDSHLDTSSQSKTGLDTGSTGSPDEGDSTADDAHSDVDQQQSSTAPISIASKTQDMVTLDNRAKPQIRHPIAARIARTPALVQGSPPKTVTWNLGNNVVYNRSNSGSGQPSQDPPPETQTKSHSRHYHHHKHKNGTSSKDEQEKSFRHHRRSNSDITNENTLEDVQATANKDSENDDLTIMMHEHFLEQSTLIMKKQIDALDDLKSGRRSMDSYREVTLTYLITHQQALQQLIQSISPPSNNKPSNK